MRAPVTAGRGMRCVVPGGSGDRTHIMQAVARSSPARRDEMQRFELLAATLSSQFARLHVEEISPAILGALELVGRAADVDACALIEFSEGESVNAVRAWPNAEAAFGNGGWPPPSLVDRLGSAKSHRFQASTA